MPVSMCEVGMKGKYTVKVSDNRVKYNFELIRNITIVQGNSGTGKTTLFDMIAAYSRLKEKSSVQLVCDKLCIALRPDSDWKHTLDNTTDSIVFIDEESDYIRKQEFASAIRQSDNYYVIFTRENLHNLPYSVEEIYEIHTSGKLHSFIKMYKQQPNYRYSLRNGRKKKVEFSHFITEDSKSGFEFYEHYFDGSAVNCISAGSNSSIYPWLTANKDKKIFVIADGAAFGAEMNRVMALQEHYPNMTICLPESFEWLILKSGLVQADELKEILDDPSDYVESSSYFSWEQFFTEYLVRNTQDTHYSYSKNELNRYYTVRNNMNQVVALIGIDDYEA